MAELLHSAHRAVALFACVLWCLSRVGAPAQITNPPPSNNLVKLLPDASRPVVYALDGSTLDRPGIVWALDATTGFAQSMILVGTNPTDMVLSPAGDILYVI